MCSRFDVITAPFIRKQFTAVPHHAETLLLNAHAAGMAGNAPPRAPTHGAPGVPPHASGLPGPAQHSPAVAGAGDEEVSMVSIVWRLLTNVIYCSYLNHAESSTIASFDTVFECPPSTTSCVPGFDNIPK